MIPIEVENLANDKFSSLSGRVLTSKKSQPKRNSYRHLYSFDELCASSHTLSGFQAGSHSALLFIGVTSHTYKTMP
jgi:hypothetical protein